MHRVKMKVHIVKFSLLKDSVVCHYFIQMTLTLQFPRCRLLRRYLPVFYADVSTHRANLLNPVGYIVKVTRIRECSTTQSSITTARLFCPQF
jgi:hypothetical protein